MTPTQKFSVVLLFLLFAFLITLSACSNQGGIQPSPFPVSTATFFTYTPEPTFAVTIPQKALLKNYVMVSVKADEGTACRLTFVPASGETLVMDAVADATGQCSWQWKLEPSYGKGIARLIFTINGVSDMHFLEILANF